MASVARSRQRGSRGSRVGLASMRDRTWLLVLVALGLIAYGLYSWVQARHRRMRVA